MSIKSFRAFSILVIAASANAQNAEYDSVSLIGSLTSPITNPDIANASSKKNTSLQCNTVPQSGNCVTTCNDGNVYTNPAWTCAVQVQEPAHPWPSGTCTAPVPDGEGNCVASCSDVEVIKHPGTGNCGGSFPEYPGQLISDYHGGK